MRRFAVHPERNASSTSTEACGDEAELRQRLSGLLAGRH